MKIGLLISTEVENDEERQEVAQRISAILKEAGYTAYVTWPDLGRITQRIENVRKEIKKL